MKTRDRKFDDFDAFSKDYRDIHDANIKISGANSDYFSEYKVQEVFKRERGNDLIKILDYGCGDGNSVKYFRQYFPRTAVEGVDISRESLESAKKRKILNANFRWFDGIRLTDYKDETFDLIFLAGVLHHVDNKYHASMLEEIYRVLKKNGRLYIFEHNPFNPLTQKLVKDCVFDTDATLLRSEYLWSLISRAGFSNLRLRYTIFFPRKGLFSSLLWLERWLAFVPIGGQYYVSAIR